MCPLCLATLVGTALAATGSTAAVGALAAKVLAPKRAAPNDDAAEVLDAPSADPGDPAPRSASGDPLAGASDAPARKRVVA